MADDFHKPTLFPAAVFDVYESGDDPARVSRVAHETAQALVARVRREPDAGVVERLVEFTSRHGIDAVAELWARSSSRSLPGALWRIYLLQTLIRQDPETSAYLFRLGAENVDSIDSVIAGASDPAGPEEITELSDRILRGVFSGDFAVALDRAASFCRLSAAGAVQLADDSDPVDEERSARLTKRALRLVEMAEALAACASLWRRDSLE